MSFISGIFSRLSKSRLITASLFSSFCWIYSNNKIHLTQDQHSENNQNNHNSTSKYDHHHNNRKAPLFFSGSTSSSLALEVTQMLGANLYNINASRFADGEINIKVDQSVRGRDVFLIHSMSPPVNESLMELLLTIATLRNASAKQITAVIPYFGYSRQSMLKGSRNGLFSCDIALMLEAVGVDKIITVDIHSEQIEGFFGSETTIDNIDVVPTFAKYINDNLKQNLDKRLVIASPDARGAPRAKKLQYILESQYKIDCEVGNLVRNRTKGHITGFDLIGDVKGADVIFVDDMIDSGDTVCMGAKYLKLHQNANSITAIATHAIFSRNARTTIQNSYLDKVIVYDSIEPKASENEYSKIERARLAPLVAQTISSYIRS